MVDDIPLAHSPKGETLPQTYFDHISNVCEQAVSNAQKAAAFYTGDAKVFIEQIEAAAIYHDLGKLDEANQAILKKDSRKPLPVAHEDAGVAALDSLGWQEAAVLSYCHHDGLFGRADELIKQGRPFRQLKRLTEDGKTVADHVDHKLKEYSSVHENSGCATVTKVKSDVLHNCGFTRRIALSCLVDADHGDTARHYGNEAERPRIDPQWGKRLEALERYVYGLPEGKSDRERKRNQLRKQMFEAGRNAPLYPSIRACDAPVGSGKTTAVMANLLRVAAERDRERQLRHIIVVLPYTNIITQSVEIYRKALVLEGEHPETIVAEHHHRADFSDLDLRQIATLWEAPIIVTTAVQFFETLGSHNTASLRKLHELPGSAVFVDEMHASIPSHLWPQVWRWLHTFTSEWGGYLVLASGSLPRFWELDEHKSLICGDGISINYIPDLISDDSLRAELKQAEQRRINYRRRPENAIALDCKGVVEFVQKEPGPRLLIVNTVQTAAVIAQTMRKTGHNVLHLSTALAPVHRDLVVNRVKQRLREKIEDWTLVSTSCVEAGMDFSFRAGFRERASTASLIQIGGRVSRGDEFMDAEVWDILLRDDQFRNNPMLSISCRALDQFSIDELNNMHPHELATTAMQREWTSGAKEKAKQLIDYEKQMEYPSVSKECRVIDADTRTVLIDQSLAEALRRGEKVSRVEIMRYSIQIWASKIAKLAIDPVITDERPDFGFYVWNYDYDPDFLGYMKGVLKLEEFIASGGAII